MKKESQPHALVLLSLLFVPLIVGWPVFQGRVYAQSDLINQFWPWKELVRRAILGGRFPLWNSLNYCGTPLLGNFQSGALYPPSLLFLILPYASGLMPFLILHLAWAGLGCFLLGRALGLARGPALAAAVLFQANPYFLQHLPALSSLSASAWTPWILLCLARNLPIPITGLCWAMQFLAGYPPEYGYTLVAAGLLVLLAPQTVPAAPHHAKEPSVARRLARAAGALGLGLALAAPVLLPGLELVRHSSRLAGAPDAVAFFSLNLVQLKSWLLPEMNRGNAEAWMTQYYPGLLAWAVVLALGMRRAWKSRAAAWAGAVMILGLLLSLGLEGWLGFPFNRRPSLALNLFHMGFCLLAGLSFQAVSAGLAGTREQIRSWLKAVGAAGLVLAAGTAALSIRSGQAGLILLPLGAMLAGAWVFWRLRRWPALAWTSLSLVLAVELAGLAWPGLAAVKHDFYQPSATALFLKPRQGDLRLLVSPSVQEQGSVMGKTPEDACGLYKDWLQANTPAAAGLRDANGYDPLAPAPVVDWLNLAAFPIFNDRPSVPALLGVGTLVDWDGNSANQRVALRRLTGSIRAVLVPTDRAKELLVLSAEGVKDPSLKAKVEGLQRLAVKYTVTLHEPYPERVDLDLDLPHPAGWLFLNDTFYPGWNARANGRPVPILRALHAFRAVPVAETDRGVVMSYEPASFWAGLWLAAMAWAGLIGWAAWRARMKS